MRVQNEFRLKKDKYKRDFSDGVVRITDVYLNKLQSLVKNLTVNGKMDEAAEVNTEIKRVRALADYIEAKKSVAFQGPPVPPDQEHIDIDEKKPDVKKNAVPENTPLAEDKKPAEPATQD